MEKMQCSLIKREGTICKWCRFKVCLLSAGMRERYVLTPKTTEVKAKKYHPTSSRTIVSRDNIYITENFEDANEVNKTMGNCRKYSYVEIRDMLHGLDKKVRYNFSSELEVLCSLFVCYFLF